MEFIIEIHGRFYRWNPQRSLSAESPTEFIVKILSRASLPHRVIPLGVISSSVYSPTELSSPASLSSSFIIPSRNEELNSILQQLQDLFSPAKTSHFHTSRYMHIRIISYDLIYVENIIAWSISCLAYDWPLPFRKDSVKFSIIFQDLDRFS